MGILDRLLDPDAPVSPGPIARHTPESLPSFLRKWTPQTVQTLEAKGYKPDQYGPIIDIDQDRARKGQFPLSAEETAHALAAVASGQAQFKAPRPGLAGRALSDLRTITTNVVKVPSQIVDEVRDLGEAPGQIAEALNEPTTKGMVKKLSQAKGLRMAPGAFIAESWASDNNGISEHPLMALLDVLPYANRAARATGPVKAAAAQGPVRRPLAVLATSAIPEGTRMKLTDKLNDLKIGPGPRELMRTALVSNREAQYETIPWMRDVQAEFVERGVDTHKAPEFFEVAVSGDPARRAALPPQERALVDWIEQKNARLAEEGVELGKIFVDAEGEIRPLAGEDKKIATLEAWQKKAEPQLREKLGMASTRYAAALDAQKQAVPMEHFAAIQDLLKADMMFTDAQFETALSSPAKQAYITARKRVFANKTSPVARAIRHLTAKEDGTVVPRKLTDAAKAMRAAEKLAAEQYQTVGWQRLANRSEEYGKLAKLLEDQSARYKQVNNLTRYGNEVARFSKQIDDKLAKLGKLRDKNPPARFVPVIQKRAQQMVLARLDELLDEGVIDGEFFDEAVELASQQAYDWIRLDDGTRLIGARELAKYLREAATEWRDIKASGISPVYVHAVDSTQAERLGNAYVRPDRIMTPTQFRKRTLDAKPALANIEVSLKHQGAELIEARTQNRLVADIEANKSWTQSLQELQTYYDSAVDAEMRATGELNRAAVFDRLMRDDNWVEWNPAEMFQFVQPRTRLTKVNEPVFVKKWVVDTIQNLYPKRKTGIESWAEKAVTAFRTSILPFSPRWHINNVISGAIMVGIDSPGAFFHINDALEMARNTRALARGERPTGPALPSGVSTGAVSVPGDVVPPLGRTADQMFQEAGGATMGRWWNLTEAGRGVRKIMDKSFAMNEWADNFYRSLAYLHGKTKAERGGFSEDVAIQEGIRAANRVLTDWDGLVPFERQILRTIFPFYGWMKHIIRFTLGLPVDHPLRIAIISRFADNEVRDLGTGIPEKFRQLFTLGKPDKFGNIKAINYRGTNPFSDVANYTTMAGFFGQLNPLIGGVAEAAGVQGATGRTDLYPDITYDPQTGRMVSRGQNPVYTVVGSVLPPLQGLRDIGGTAILGRIGMEPDDIRALRLNNPQAFRNRIYSSIGLPTPPQKLNLGREVALAEVARRSAAHRALAEALKSGDWRHAKHFPEVAPVLRQIAAIPREQLPMLAPQGRYTEGTTPSLNKLLGGHDGVASPFLP